MPGFPMICPPRAISARASCTVRLNKFVRIFSSDPAELGTRSLTLLEPAPAWVCTGFFSMLVRESQKSRNRFVMLPVDKSVNWTSSGANPDVGLAEKSATGFVVPLLTTNVTALCKVTYWLPLVNAMMTLSTYDPFGVVLEHQYVNVAPLKH